MPGSDNRETMENLEKLSEIVIATLKELSANRQPLSAASLCQALLGNETMAELLSMKSMPERETVSSIQEKAQIKELKLGIRNLQQQRERDRKRFAELEDQLARIQGFSKRSVFALTTLARTKGNESFFAPLDQLRQRIGDDSDLERLEEALNLLKDGVLQKDANRPEESGGLLPKWFKRKEPSAPVEAELPLKQLQSAYLNIIKEFHTDLGKDYLGQFHSLQKRVRESRSADELFALNDDVLAFLQSYIRLMNEEREQVGDFMTEFGRGLMEMEKQLLASATNVNQVHESNDLFGTVLQGQMDDINRSAQVSKTLAEFKDIVSLRLTSIKTALEAKQKEDLMLREEANRQVLYLQENLHSIQKEIEQAQAKSKSLEMESLTDPLTAIPNRRAYQRRFREELQRFQRYKQQFALLLFDIDHFKKVNDSYGHRAGDKCLVEIIKRIKPTLRDSDFLARFGGEEFVIILPGTDLENATNAADRIRGLIEKTRFVYQGQTIPLTISVGVTQAQPTDQDLDTIFMRVDKALYEAKNTGRNRVASI
ncbi:MAG: GGDEF domain-containing protein [Acidobacteriota bacterium]